jgi:hypothetical protein
MSAPTSTWAFTAWIFMGFATSVFLENLRRNFYFHSNLAKIAGTLHDMGSAVA